MCHILFCSPVYYFVCLVIYVDKRAELIIRDLFSRGDLYAEFCPACPWIVHFQSSRMLPPSMTLIKILRYLITSVIFLNLLCLKPRKYPYQLDFCLWQGTFYTLKTSKSECQSSFPARLRPMTTYRTTKVFDVNTIIKQIVKYSVISLPKIVKLQALNTQAYSQQSNSDQMRLNIRTHCQNRSISVHLTFFHQNRSRYYPAWYQHALVFTSKGHLMLPPSFW